MIQDLREIQQHAESFKSAFLIYQQSEVSFEGVVTGAYFEEEQKLRHYSDENIAGAQSQQ